MPRVWLLAALLTGWLTVLSACTSAESHKEGGAINASDIKERSGTLLPNSGSEKFELVQDNGTLALYVKPATTEIAVKDKRTGQMWYSNPQNRAQDTIANGSEKLKLSSQVSISLFDTMDRQIQMDNFAESISYSQFQLYRIDQGIRVVYTIGKQEKTYLVPRVIGKARFEDKILNSVKDESSRKALLSRYKLVTLDSVNDKTKEQLLQQYPALAKEDQYVTSDKLPDFVLSELSEIIGATGYTLGNLHDDQILNRQEVQTSIAVTLSIEYTLDKGNLIVTLPVKQIKYDSKEFRLYQLDILPYFGAADQRQEGYMFIPDGSGALIHLNNNKTKYPPIELKVYGRDKAIYQKDLNENTEQVYLPVFGLKQGSNAFVAIIEESDAVATIRADVAGRDNSYNTVSSAYSILPNAKRYLSFRGNSGVNVYAPKPLDSDIRIRYGFLSGEDSTYVGMGHYYQNYLSEHGLIAKTRSDTAITPPFYLSLVGGVEHAVSKVGIPYRSLKPLTTYSQAIQLAEQLQQKGVSSLAIKYEGWANGGIEHTAFNKIQLNTKLGGTPQFRRLIQYSKEHGISLYPSVDFMYIAKNKWFDGFESQKDTARFLTGDVAKDYSYGLASKQANLEGTARYIVSPGSFPRLVESFLQSYDRLGLQSASLASLGTDLYADYRESKPIDRQQALDVAATQLSGLSQSGLKLSMDGANAYAIPYADLVMNAPLDSSHYYLEDEAVPFYQIVLHGVVAYAGKPLNLGDDFKKSVLQTVETGAGIHFQWMYEDNAYLKDTDYNEYSLNYKPWLTPAADLYKRVLPLLQRTRNAKIADHRRLDDQVYQTTYDNGVSVIVNYRSEDVVVQGVRVKAEDFAVIGGEEHS